MKKTNNKGFTLVELIVVLVILAILAAILVPALLGYIDKARQKQAVTNAEAAYVAAQALATEYYGKNNTLTTSGRAAAVQASKIQDLADIQEKPFKVSVGFKTPSITSSVQNKTTCIINAFRYTDSSGNIAVWNSANGNWEVLEAGKGKTAPTTFTENAYQVTASEYK